VGRQFHQRALVGYVIIPAGFRTATITVQPLASSIGTGDKTVQVSLVYADGLAAISPTASSAAVTIVGARQTGLWKLDETSGTIAHDISGNNRNGTVYGSPTWTSGYIDGGLRTNGTPNQYVSVSNATGAFNFNASDPFSISAWVKLPVGSPLTSSNDYMIMSRFEGWGDSWWTLDMSGGYYNGVGFGIVRFDAGGNYVGTLMLTPQSNCVAWFKSGLPKWASWFVVCSYCNPDLNHAPFPARMEFSGRTGF
jgi:hypothetical protein